MPQYRIAGAQTRLQTAPLAPPRPSPLGQAVSASVALGVVVGLGALALGVELASLRPVLGVLALPFVVVAWAMLRDLYEAVGHRRDVLLTPDAATRETIRLVPTAGGRLVSDRAGGRSLAEEDLRYLVERLPARGHTVRAWLGQTLPSGLTLSLPEELEPLYDALESIGALVSRGERRAGKIVMTPEEIKRRLSL